MMSLGNLPLDLVFDREIFAGEGQWNEYYSSKPKPLLIGHKQELLSL